MLIIDAKTVRELCPMEEAISAMRGAFESLAQNQVNQPLRLMARLSVDNTLALMPAEIRGEALGVKFGTIFPGNAAVGRPQHCLLVAMFDTTDGRLTAVIDGSELTAIRTAATSALATDILAKKEATALGVLGAGIQAKAHLNAMVAVRPITTAQIWSRQAENAAALAGWAERELGIACRSVADPALACMATIVCTTTSSPEPLVTADMIAPGTHINAIGASFPQHRELAADVVSVASVFVDSREAALVEAGDLLLAQAEGRFGMEAIRGDLGNLVLGKHPGRCSDSEITLFKSVGLALQDIQMGAVVEARARQTATAGLEIPFSA